MEPVGPDYQTGLFSRSNEPRAVHEFFGDPEFRCDFCQKISWTSVKTLSMELVGPDGQTSPFLAHEFMVSWNFTVTFAKIFINVHYDLIYGVRLSR
ncbi:hypothetical protein H5410_012935 [Solanum commersonii]|uniref:Uncharacterized protein n=1 Tax=Solanum commersonii TaxID=4109 RepID=A0A9J6AT16_SOLCO|nr:hypothetical protein H5410_012935 [Solanum commersonii]